MAKTTRKTQRPLSRIVSSLKSLDPLEASHHLAEARANVANGDAKRLLMQARIKVLTDAARNAPAAPKALPKPEPEAAPPVPMAAEAPPATPKRGLLEDEAYLAIFRDMIQDTKANLQSILEIYAANPEEGWKSAGKEAGNLAYAATQMELEDWSEALTQLTADTPAGVDQGTEVILTLLRRIDELAVRDLPSSGDA